MRPEGVDRAPLFCAEDTGVSEDALGRDGLSDPVVLRQRLDLEVDRLSRGKPGKTWQPRIGQRLFLGVNPLDLVVASKPKRIRLPCKLRPTSHSYSLPR